MVECLDKDVINYDALYLQLFTLYHYSHQVFRVYSQFVSRRSKPSTANVRTSLEYEGHSFEYSCLMIEKPLASSRYLIVVSKGHKPRRTIPIVSTVETKDGNCRCIWREHNRCRYLIWSLVIRVRITWIMNTLAMNRNLHNKPHAHSMLKIQLEAGL